MLEGHGYTVGSGFLGFCADFPKGKRTAYIYATGCQNQACTIRARAYTVLIGTQCCATHMTLT